MKLSDEIRLVRQKSLLTQENFANELNVAIPTVNRWETGKARPNLSTMKNIKTFCERHNFSFSEIESSWLVFPTEDKNGNSQ